MRVLFAGGGTGGHVCPAVAVARALTRLAPETETLFLGTSRPVEKRILDKAELPHIALASAPLGWRTLGKNARGFMRAYLETRRFMPSVVLGLGGYASAPGVLAGRAVGAKVALFEPNAVPGKATTTLARFAEEVYVRWTQPVATNVVQTGVPLNENGVAPPSLTKRQARALLDLPEDRPCVLIVGGSQGARPLNRWIMSSIHEVAPRVSFIHIAGSEDLDLVRHAYATAEVEARVVPFLDGMGTAYRAATFAVARAGAATLAELAAEGLPAMLVPLPSSALDHQRANARAYELAGGAVVKDESELSEQTLAQVVALCEDEPLLEGLAARARVQARPRAAMAIAERILTLGDYRIEAATADTDIRTAGRVPAHAL
ncbi:MAG TPA: UDP-N-acetylglucosamine--N-acetylmuramyl-(pentapeptide) pyrophosphoryl-undecaprenol N-acetylglucosamine transferase [Planctomycetota bacterium]|nr:UDP-N-acetylglucosamine--N-acetylmuramyl-(pentapeptide) pyrophosphoryl-undecaprenol N-acetylglucosamine transferase [Planctomycetota bacterium]